MRAFNANPGYAKGIPPRIEWDDNFIPPDLYPTLPSVPEAPGYVEGGMNEEAGKAPGEDRRTADKGKGKAKAGGETIGGKAPEPPRDSTTRVTSTAQVVPTKPKAKKKRKVVSAETVENSDEEGNPAAQAGGEIIGGTAPEPPRDSTTQRVTSTAQVVPAKPKANKKRKVVSAETVENSDEEWNPAALTTPPAPARRPPTVKQARSKRRPATIPTADVGPPPPCTRCVMYSKKCVHNGWRAACRTCVEARQKCSLTKAVPPTVLINDSSLPVAGPSNPQPKVKIVIPRTMYAERSLPRKRVPQSPSPTPSEEASGVSPTPADLATTSHLPLPSHLLTDPPAASGTRRVLPAIPAEPRSKFLSFY